MSRQGTTRGSVYASHLRSLSIVAVQFVLVAAGLWVLGWVVARTWVVILPVVLAVIVCTVLWPPVRWLRSRSVPPALAALIGVVVAAAAIAGVVAAVAPSIADQVSKLSSKAVDGIRQVQDWMHGPPLNISDAQLNSAVSAITGRLESSGTQVASGFFTGVSAATSALITLFTTAVITFFLLKDGPRFLPWLRRSVGSPAAPHLAEVLTRMWRTLGGFIRTQALVSLVDAVLIGVGLVILGVPLAYVLAIITFVGGFVPIVGAFVAGALAVLIALVSNGVVTALIVLAIILAVQQLEGNILQPWLQSKSMNLHAVVVLLAVTLGGTVFGVIGAFLAVPVAACGAVAVRYYGEQVRARTADPEDVEKRDAAGEGEREASDEAGAGSVAADET